MPARDHDAPAATPLRGIIGSSHDGARGPCCDRQGSLGPPSTWQLILASEQTYRRVLVAEAGLHSARVSHARCVQIGQVSRALCQSWSQ